VVTKIDSAIFGLGIALGNRHMEDEMGSFNLISVVVMASFFCLSAFAAKPEITCRIKTNDVGQIVARGESSQEALSKAREACTDRRVAYYEGARGVAVDESRMSDFIDSCVNLECFR